MIHPVFIGKAFLWKDNKLVKSESLKVAELVEAPSVRQAHRKRPIDSTSASSARVSGSLFNTNFFI